MATVIGTLDYVTDVWPDLVADPEAPAVHIAADWSQAPRNRYPVETVGWPYTDVNDSPNLRELSAPQPYFDNGLPCTVEYP